MDLGRTQLLSLIAKAITTALGIIQSIIVIRILSPAEFGLVGLVMSVGGVIGVSQHLGIVDGAIREIAVLKKKRDAGKVFWVSHIVRQAVTIPLSIGLLLLAGVIATKIYHRPEIALYLQIFAAALVLQGLQDVLGAALTGLKKFFLLYVVQVVTATINIAVFGWLTWQFGVTGFFWAVIVTTSIMVLWFFGLMFRELRGYLAWPTWGEIKHYGRRVMRVGAYMYLSRIFFVVWQRLPILLLGGVLTSDGLGYLNVSLTFGSRLTIIAMALSEVNLAWMSSLFANQRAEFQKTVTHNMHRVLVVMVGLTLVLLFFTPEILQYVIGAQYLPAQPLIYIMTTAFFLYALTDIGTSSVFVSADQPRMRAIVYGIMTTITAVIIGWLLAMRPDALLAAGGVLAGALVSYIVMVVIAKARFKILLLTPQLALFLVALGASVVWLFSEPGLAWRLSVFILLGGYIVWEARRSKLLPSVWKLARGSDDLQKKIVCFAGAAYDLPYWTNRQHIMSRMAKHYPVLYVEPRVWFLRQIIRKPGSALHYLKRLWWYEKRDESLFVISQWNLIPGSRESKIIALINHWLNRWRVLFFAGLLGFRSGKTVMWIYDTEAAEYLNAFDDDTVIYDCVDDHAAQAGADRNADRVEEEEDKILKRADLVTVTSKRLYELKRDKNKNVQLVLNAGDVSIYSSPDKNCGGVDNPLAEINHPIIGTVGALDEYKIDVDMMMSVAKQKPDWQFVFVGESVVESKSAAVKGLQNLPNVHFTGAVNREVAPCYVKWFDVCMIPYRSSRYNEASFPLKFWEFMATGKPVVVGGLPELEVYKEVVGYANGADEFIKLCEAAINQPSLNSSERVAMAREHGWEERVEHLRELLERKL